MFEKRKKIFEREKNRTYRVYSYDSPKRRKYALVQSINVTRATRGEILYFRTDRARSNNYLIYYMI